MSSHEIHHLLNEYGLTTVFLAVALQALGLPVPGSTALVAAAVYASSRHSLPLAGVIAAGALGALVGTIGGFAIGRWRGERVLLRIGRWVRQSPQRIQQLRAEFNTHAWTALFVARFITGGRNIAGLAAGASGISLQRFVLISAAAAIVWSAVVSVEYYFFGGAFLGAATWLQVVLIVVGIAATILSLGMLRRRANERLEDASTPAAGE